MSTINIYSSRIYSLFHFIPLSNSLLYSILLCFAVSEPGALPWRVRKRAGASTVWRGALVGKPYEPVWKQKKIMQNSKIVKNPVWVVHHINAIVPGKQLNIGWGFKKWGALLCWHWCLAQHGFKVSVKDAKSTMCQDGCRYLFQRAHGKHACPRRTHRWVLTMTRHENPIVYCVGSSMWPRVLWRDVITTWCRTKTNSEGDGFSWPKKLSTLEAFLDDIGTSMIRWVQDGHHQDGSHSSISEWSLGCWKWCHNSHNNMSLHDFVIYFVGSSNRIGS